MGDGCWIGEWVWAEDGEACVGGAAVGDCWAASSGRCCWCSNGSVCPIVGVVRVGFGIVWWRSKVSSKKGQGNDTLYEKRQIPKKWRVLYVGMSLAIAVEGKIFSNCMAILRASTQKVGGRFA
ncbi:hypothetical protein Tco_1298271 [Tanacetum coccineum]